MAASSRFSQGCRTALGQVVTPLSADVAVGRVEQRQDLGRAVAEVLVRLARRVALGLPRLAGVRDVWYGPAWSVHQTASPIASPVR